MARTVKLDDITDKFLSHLETEQRSSGHTVEAYGRDIRQFAGWLCDSADISEFDARSVTTSDVRAWIGSLADEGRTATTLRRKAQSLRAFFKWGMKAGLFQGNPASDISLAKKRKPLPNFIKEAELEEILATQPADFKSMRTHTVLSLLYSLGLRQAELLSITDSDINLTAKELRVTGKRNKQRVLPLPKELCNEIAEWQRVRNMQYPNLTSPAPLIAGPHGRLSRETLYKIVREGLAEVSAGRKSPHTLRHSFATAMINHGADLDAVKEMMGHSSLSTTQIYTHLSYKELLANYRGAHPRNNKNSQNK